MTVRGEKYEPEAEPSEGVRKGITAKEEAEEVANRSLIDGNLKFRLPPPPEAGAKGYRSGRAHRIVSSSGRTPWSWLVCKGGL
ncbi:MAG: hypothetical protein ABSG92_06375 [Conexivisphaerales archaeon]